MRITQNNTNYSSQTFVEHLEQSYTETAKQYLDNIIGIIASYAPLITFWATLLHTIPEIEAYAIIKDYTATTTTPEPDQVDIRPIPSTTTIPCFHTKNSRGEDIKFCYKPSANSCIIL